VRPPVAFFHSFVPLQVAQELGDGGMDRVKVGVISDVMFLQCGADISSPPGAQHPHLFPNDFEGSDCAQSGEHSANRFAASSEIGVM
jgi:hypothetical protein